MTPGGATRFSTLRSFSRDPEQARPVSRETVRRILAFARPYRRQIWTFLVLVIIAAGLVVATPLLFRRIVDDGVLAGDRQVVVTIALIIAALAVFEGALTLAQRWYSARIGEGLIYDLRTQVFGHVQRMPLAFFTRTQTGALVSRLNNDVIGAQQAFTSVMSGVVSNVISLALVVGTMALLSWPITLVALAMLPLFLLPARWAGRKLAGLTRQQMQLNAEMGTSMTERFGVGGALLVKLFGRPDEEDAAFSAKAAGVRDLGVQIAMSSRVFFSALALVAALATALVYGVGGLFAISGTLTVGTLLALSALMGRLYGPLTALSNVRVDVMTALVSFERVFEVLDLEPMLADREGAAELVPDPRGVGIELEHVGFHYPRADEVSLASLEAIARHEARESGPVLRDVSFTVQPGQMVALVGPSGAGKTTLTHLVARLYDVDSGAARVGGQDVRDVTQLSLHDVVGQVTQDAHMFHDTIAANLRYAAPEAATSNACRAAGSRSADLVAALPRGSTVVGDRGYRLSGGERQRLAIARLLLKHRGSSCSTRPPPTSTPIGGGGAACARRGARGPYVAGDRAPVVDPRHADMIVVLDEGRVVQQGTHEQLVAQPGLYAELYRTQFAPGADASPVGAVR